MRFQKTTEYAIRVMTFLALHKDERYSVARLHQALGIPYKYLGHLMNKLAQAGFVSVEQGKHGGYRIARPLESIYLYQIIGVVEGLDDYDRCVLGFPQCSDENPCPLHGFWKGLQKNIKDVLFDISLEDLRLNATGKV